MQQARQLAEVEHALQLRIDAGHGEPAFETEQFAVQADETLSFVPVVSAEPVRAGKAGSRDRTASIEIAIGAFKVRVRNGADMRTVAAVLRAVKRAGA